MPAVCLCLSFLDAHGNDLIRPAVSRDCWASRISICVCVCVCVCQVWEPLQLLLQRSCHCQPGNDGCAEQAHKRSTRPGLIGQSSILKTDGLRASRVWLQCGLNQLGHVKYLGPSFFFSAFSNMFTRNLKTQRFSHFYKKNTESLSADDVCA